MPPPDDIVRVTEDPLDVAGLMSATRTDACGAVASFVGVVRNEHRGKAVRHLVYEAYPAMAERELRRIISDARSRWTLERVALVHRMGRLEIGEASVAIVVAAAHRREALEACSFLIESIKESVPVWKKEFTDEGEDWVVGDPSPP